MYLCTNVTSMDVIAALYRPTIEEFKDFSKYVSHMESKGAHKAGIAKIIPPEGWAAAKQYDMEDIGEMIIETPVAQTVTGHQGLFQLFNVQKKPLTVKEFRELSESTRFKGPSSTSEAEDKFLDDKVERQYWKNITFNQPIYGADVPGSIYDDDVEHWNITRLGTILDLMGTKVFGVNTPYLYFGMWKTTFPWHTEDMDLYSINYLHFGAPKSWYAIAPEQGKRLETLAKGFFSGSFRDCSQFMRHKMTIISPHVLKKFSIPVQKITQYQGEFMITFPYGYHSGYNHGFNIAESTNFASERWIEYGRKAKYCQCKFDSVKIDMDIFIKKYQPEEWKKLLQERRNDEDIDTHNKRKTARANYLSESSPVKVKLITTGRKNAFDARKKIEYKLDKSEEETNSDRDSSTSEDSDVTTDSDDSSSSDQEWDILEDSDQVRQPAKFEPKGKFRCNYDRDMHKAELARTKLNQCSRRSISGIQRKLYKSDSSKVKDKKDSVTTYHTSHLLKDLWSHMPPDRKCERSFNEILSSTEAKCAVCLYFSQNDSNYLHHMDPSKVKTVGSNHSNQGKLLVTELCFAMDTSEENSIETAFNLMFGNADASKESCLLTCAECSLCVHSSCYGVYDFENSADWFCDKCKFMNSYKEKLRTTNPSANSDKYLNELLDVMKCSLCCIRSGALKKTTTGDWCHIVCAIAIPQVFFVNKRDRGPIDISLLNPARRSLNCLYCSHLSKSPSSRGACIQCKCGKCATAFHATCNFHHGIPLYLGDWPVCVETLCPKHSKFKVVTQAEKRSLTEVATDDLVFAKHKNGRYYRGKVIDIQKVLYYKVVFDDKSFCFDLPPNDIQGVDAKTNIVAAGEIVDILWPDSMTYRAEVTGHWYETVCQIRYEDGSILHVKRGDLYVDGEEIPKKIQSKLSYASETKNKFYLPATMNVVSKRPRIGSWRYKNKDPE